MGQPQSTLSASVVTDIASDALMSTTQDCVTVTQGDQIMYVGGSGNVFENNSQTMELNVDSTCLQKVQQTTDMTSKVQNEIVQNLKDTQQAMMQWADNSKRDVATNVTNHVRSSIRNEVVQNCLNNIQGKQIMAVQGQGNVFRNNVQKQTINVVAQCIQGAELTSKMSTDVSNTVNQHLEYEAKSPLSFITDAITGTMKSFMAIAAIIFIVVLCFVFVFLIVKGKGGANDLATLGNSIGRSNFGAAPKLKTSSS